MAEKPEDLQLPLAVINRIINEAIPPNTIVSTEVRKTLCRTATVFVLYTTATAGAIAGKHGRKTMNANDVLEAISEMDFPQFIEPLKKSLNHYRDIQQKKKETTLNRKAEDANKPSSSTNTPSTSGTKSPPSKKRTPPGKHQESPQEVVTLSDSDSS